MAYYIPYADGSYSRKANISIPQSYIDAQTPGPELAFSKPWSGTGGIAFSGSCYEAVLTHWILSPHAWTEEELIEYFSVPADELPTLDLYDKVSSFIVPGVYPNLTDVKGNLTGGALINGEPSDFLVWEQMMGCLVCYEEVLVRSIGTQTSRNTDPDACIQSREIPSTLGLHWLRNKICAKKKGNGASD